MDRSIKILVGYHKPSVLVKSEIFEPIHLGRALSVEENSKDGKVSNSDYQWMLDNMIGDDSGENISRLNRRFCELTGIYWAWKNLDKLDNPDYIGFMHYRRFINFTDKKFRIVNGDTVKFRFLDEDYRKNTGLDDETVKKCVKDYDIVTVETWKIGGCWPRNVRAQYEKAEFLHREDYALAMDILKEKYPEFTKAAEIYNKSHSGYYTNIFVMKKDVFNEFVEWLFDILFECEDKIPYRNIIEDDRVIGHIAERLFGIYITYLKMTNKKLRIKECQRTFIEKPDLEKELVPSFSNEVSVVMSSDAKYAPYLGVCIKSLIENTTKEHNYCVYVLNTDICAGDIKRISDMQTENCRIRFVDVSDIFLKYDPKLFHTYNYFTIATYYRFFIPQLFKNFEKVIYCDCDAVFLDDVAKLYSVNIGENLIGAIKDTVALYTINKSKGIGDYYSNYLGLKEPKNYCQAGMLVMNIPEMLKINFTEKCIETLTLLDRPLYLDQCTLNKVCDGRVYFLHEEWNVMCCMSNFIKDFSKHLPNDVLTALAEASQHPRYMHFCGFLKPWQLPSLEYSEYFWKYAKMTNYYEQIIYDNVGSYNVNTYRYSKLIPPRPGIFLRLKRMIFFKAISYENGKKFRIIKLYKFHFRICVNKNKLYNINGSK